MLRALALAALLLAGCAAAPGPTHTQAATHTSATTSATTASVAKAPPPPPPQVGTCDLTVTSAGTGTGAVRTSNCPVADAIRGLSKDAKSLLVEVTWDSLPPTALALHSSLENFAACGSAPLPDPTSNCSQLALNTSMVPPVRIVLEGEAFAKHGAGASAFENVYTGAAVQQSFRLTFSAFTQERVPANYTALR
ncbi:MAG TPA: hypothetical protein VM241_04590 [Candidatus Thermoplasmatota archaeon]|nr:hypothetical protein [Candidatus Thermoplasmatota archaeon]